MTPTLIGINGFKTSGKDTTYRLLSEAVAGVQRAAFADKLKIMAAMALGFEGDPATLIALMDDAKESWVMEIRRVVPPSPGHRASWLDPVKNLTGREYLQWFGGNARTVFGDTFWVDQVLPNPDEIGYEAQQHELCARYPLADVVAVTDVRYPNEAERVRELGGVVWEVVRPGIDSDGHASEKPLPTHLVDHVIVNDSSLDDLQAKVLDAFSRVS